MFLRKDVLKLCSKVTGEHSCRSAISIKLESNFTEITLRHGCSPVNILHIFRTPFHKNPSRRLLLNIAHQDQHQLTVDNEKETLKGERQQLKRDTVFLETISQSS